jgi:hypothetical protein
MLKTREIVELRTAGGNGDEVVPAYVVHPNAPGVKIFGHAGLSVVQEYDVQPCKTPREPFIPMRLRLPQGVWKEPSGAYVFFSRDRCPLWRVDSQGGAEMLEPWQHIQSEGESALWDDSNPPWRNPSLKKKLDKTLADKGLVSMPALAGALDAFFRHNCEDVREAVRHLVPADAENVAADLAA